MRINVKYVKLYENFSPFEISESQFPRQFSLTLTLDSPVNGKRFLQTDRSSRKLFAKFSSEGNRWIPGLKGNVKFRFATRVNPISAENFVNFLP